MRVDSPREPVSSHVAVWIGLSWSAQQRQPHDVAIGSADVREGASEKIGSLLAILAVVENGDTVSILGQICEFVRTDFEPDDQPSLIRPKNIDAHFAASQLVFLCVGR